MNAPCPLEPMETDCRHAAGSDDAFTRRMRFHQSWYRRHMLGLPPGPNPAARGALYGNMLRDEDGRRGRNFLTGAIWAEAERRIAEGEGTVEPSRLRNNLLSSQPMCFNLFAPLASDLALASRLVAALPGVPDGIRVTGVQIEHAPPPETHLRDRTAFDAFIAYERDGVPGFIGIETKLTEPFTAVSYRFDMHAGYARWKDFSGYWWETGSEGEFPNPVYNQLWRNHLLAYAMLRQPAPQYQEAFVAVVSHDLDTRCDRAVEAYRAILTPAGDATLLSWKLGPLVEAWRCLVPEPMRDAWLDPFHLRYLDLGRSLPAWEHWTKRNAA